MKTNYILCWSIILTSSAVAEPSTTIDYGGTPYTISYQNTSFFSFYNTAITLPWYSSTGANPWTIADTFSDSVGFSLGNNLSNVQGNINTGPLFVWHIAGSGGNPTFYAADVNTSGSAGAFDPGVVLDPTDASTLYNFATLVSANQIYSSDNLNFNQQSLSNGVTYTVNSGVNLSAAQAGTMFYGTDFNRTSDALANTVTIINSGNIGSTQVNGVQPFDYYGILNITNSGNIIGYMNNTVNSWGGLNIINNPGALISSSGGNTTLSGNSPVYLAGITDITPSMTVLNNGIISASGNGNYVLAFSGGGILNIINNSLITSNDNNGTGIYTNYAADQSAIINTGSILVGDSGYGIYVDTDVNSPTGSGARSITTLSNTGNITTGTSGFGIYNQGQIVNLTNGQGGDGSAASKTALTYYGNLPTSYFIFVTNLTHYGQITFSSPSGVMAFNVAPNSNLLVGTYSNVLSGITSDNLSNSSGTFGIYNWTLSNAGSFYDLIVTQDSTGSNSHITATTDNDNLLNPSGSNLTNPLRNFGYSFVSIDNAGSISVSPNYDAIFSGGNSANIRNSGEITISGSHSSGIDVYGENVTIENSGLINGSGSNVSAITIQSGSSSILNIGTLISSGDSASAIAINGGNASISNSGLISTSGNSWGISVNAGSAAIQNSGTITGAGGIANTYGSISSLENSGIIENLVAPLPGEGYAIGTLTGIGLISNSGTIRGVADGGIVTGGLIGSIINSGSISSDFGVGISTRFGTYYDFGFRGSIDTIRNLADGTIYGYSNALVNANIIGTLANSGILEGYSDSGIFNAGNFNSVVNSGQISGGQYGILNYSGTYENSEYVGAINTINNSGFVKGGSSGIYNADSTIDTLSNSGTIYATADASYGIYNTASGLISTLNNIGSIKGTTFDVYNLGQITKLSNSQGLSSTNEATKALNYFGVLPGAYYEYIASISDFGRIVFTSPQGVMTFGIDPGSVVSVGTYSDVLSGITASNLRNTTGRFGNYSWSLENGGGYYNLVVTSGSSGSDSSTSLDNLTPQNGSIAVDHGTSAAVSGNYSATDTVKVNGGSLTIANGGNFNAPLNVAGGAVSITAGGTLTSTAPVVVASGTLEILGNLNAPLNVSGGTVSIGTGGTLRSDNTVAVSGGSLSISGSFIAPLRVDNNGAVTVSAGGSFTSSTAVSIGNGTFSVSGNVTAPISVSGSTTLSAASLSSFSPSFVLSSSGALTGDLTLSNGGARVNGTVNGSANVGSGAALRGTGTITGASTVSSGGILAPGNSPGIMTFTAPLTQGSGSTLSLDIDGTTAGTGAGNYSKILVTGSGNTYTIGSGVTIKPNLRDITGSANNTFTPSIGDVFTVVSADGGLSGTFSTLMQPSSGLTSGTRFIDLYTSTEVQLKVVKSGYSTIGSSSNSNLGNVGSAIDSVSGMTGDRSTLMNAIFALTGDTDSTTALKQLSGDIQTVSPVAAVQSSRAIGTVVDNRMASLRGGTTDTSLNSELFDFSSLTTTGTSQVVGSIIKGFSQAADREFSDSKPWMKVLTRSSSGSSDSNGLGVNSSTVGAAAGIDYTLNSKGFVGAAIGVASNSITNGQTVTTTSASLYGSHDIGSAYIASRLSFALDDYRGSRSIEFGTISRTALANTYGYQLGGAIEVGNRYRFGKVSGELYGSLESGWLQRAAYTESGADSANLTVDELKAQTSISKLGIRLNSILSQTESGSIQAFSDLAWGHDFGDQSITTSHTLMGSSFSLEGPNVGRDSAEIGFGIVSEDTKGYRFFAKYAGEFRKMEVSRTAELGVTMTW